jgi:hypothetical protein
MTTVLEDNDSPAIKAFKNFEGFRPQDEDKQEKFTLFTFLNRVKKS